MIEKQIKKNKALLVHLAKTGGSSMSTAPFILKHGSQSVPPTTDFLKSMFRFSFVREPYARFASAVLNLGYATPETFEEFVTTTFKKEHKKRFAEWDFDWMNLIPMSQMLHCKRGWFRTEEPQVDFVGRFETLKHDWAKVCDAVDHYHELPHKNKSAYSGTDYGNFYNKKTKAIVGAAYGLDFKIFGYER